MKALGAQHELMHSEAPTVRGLRNVQVPNPVQALAPLRRELLEAAHPAGYAKPTLIQIQAYVKKRPLLDDTTAQDGPYAIILALRRELVIQIEEVLNQRGSCSTCQRGCSASRSRPYWRRPRRTSGRGL